MAAEHPLSPREHQAAATLLRQAGWPAGKYRITLLKADGSSRRFLRIHHTQAHKHAVAVLPPCPTVPHLAEARSTWLLGRHLEAANVPVPHLLGHDPSTAMVILADLGDQRLYDLTAEAHASGDWNTAMTSYTQVVEELAHMQIQAAQGLDPTWCWDTPNYDLDLMLQRESGYFLQALCTDLLGLSWDRKAVDRERLAIAQGAAQADSGFFLHRDFQSRNIMIFQNRPWFIDFQGGRLGPLGYDLASLLIDPYAALPVEMQHRLMARYLTILARLIPVEETAFRSQYHFLSLQRGMQIAGAFANLGYLQGKEFFLPYLRPTLDFLMHTLDPAFPALTKLCHQAQLALEQQHLQGSPTSRRGRDT